MGDPQKPARPMPTSAFLAVTLLCNSRCVMCDIWKHRGKDFLPLSVYSKLPSSLRMVDITGGEPFLRPDIPELVATVRAAAPRARILITTNGFLTKKITSTLSMVRKADPNIAYRLSLDGWGKTHDTMRGIPGAFDMVMESLAALKAGGVRDLGLTFTLTKHNTNELSKVHGFCRKEGYLFSLNVVHDSPVYFGTSKTSLRPSSEEVAAVIRPVVRAQLLSVNPKDWAKAWLNANLASYVCTHIRPLPCGAGRRFFYLDPFGNVYPCHLKNWPVGNLTSKTFAAIWQSAANERFSEKADSCNDCWISCTAKDAIADNPLHILRQLPGVAREAYVR